MFDAATRHARHELATRLVADHPGVVATAEVTCNQAPLIMQGSLCDGRLFLFRARHGQASLAAAVPDQPEQPVPVSTGCPDTVAVEDIEQAAAVFAALLRRHHDLHREPGSETTR